MPTIVAVHLLNDYSGSPRVLSTLIKGFRQKEIAVDVVTGNGSKGFLSELDVRYNYIPYRFHDNRWRRLLAFFISQWFLFWKIWSYRNQDTIIYINTLLPFGAGLAGWLSGQKVIYHIHESSLKPAFLKKFLKKIAFISARELIYVSQFLLEQEHQSKKPAKVIYNALSENFVAKAEQLAGEDLWEDEKPFSVLMLCSLKAYKGVNEYVELARRLPDYEFRLVLNAQQTEVDTYFSGQELPQNLQLFPAQRDVHPFYRQADILLNLSHPEQWVETFGLTLLEGMQYGLPVIAPPVGGPAELVADLYNGFSIDQRNTDRLVGSIQKLANGPELYRRLSDNAIWFAGNFRFSEMVDQIVELIFTGSPEVVPSVTFNNQPHKEQRPSGTGSTTSLPPSTTKAGAR